MTWPSLYMCVPTKPTVAKARLLSVVGALAHSGVWQGLSLQSRPGGGEVDGYRSQVPTAVRREFCPPSLVAQALGLSCGFSSTLHVGFPLAFSGRSPSEHPRRLGRARGERGNGGRDFSHKHARLWSPLPVPSGCLFAADHSPLPDPGFQHPASIHTSTHDSGWKAQG